MWGILQRNQEAAQVGAAGALVMLALLVKGSSLPHSTSPSELITPTFVSVSRSVPDDPEYYRQKWRKIADAYYASHPVGSPSGDSRRATNRVQINESPSDVATASLTDRGFHSTESAGNEPGSLTPVDFNPEVDIESQVDIKSEESLVTNGLAQAVFSRPKPAPYSPEASVSGPAMDSPSVLLTANPQRMRVGIYGPYAVAAAVATGLLCSICFQGIWPSQRVEPESAIVQSGALRLEIPSEWVRVQPAFRERLKPIVLGSSYVFSAAAAWYLFAS